MSSFSSGFLKKRMSKECGEPRSDVGTWPESAWESQQARETAFGTRSGFGMDKSGDQALLAGIDDLSASFAGELGVYSKNLTTGEEVAYHADEVMPTASV